jgi:hypothetical protein
MKLKYITQGQLDAIELVADYKSSEGRVYLDLTAEIRHLLHLLEVREMVQTYTDMISTAWGRFPVGEWMHRSDDDGKDT